MCPDRAMQIPCLRRLRCYAPFASMGRIQLHRAVSKCETHFRTNRLLIIPPSRSLQSQAYCPRIPDRFRKLGWIDGIVYLSQR